MQFIHPEEFKDMLGMWGLRLEGIREEKVGETKNHLLRRRQPRLIHGCPYSAIPKGCFEALLLSHETRLPP